MKKVLMLGFCIPDDEMKKSFHLDKNPSIQTHRFIWSIVKILESIKSIDVDYISNRQISTFPVSKEAFVKSRQHVGYCESGIREVGFINLPGVKLISRFFMSFFTVWNKIRFNKYDALLVYSVHLPYLVIAYLVSKLFGLEIISLWTDPPSVNSSKNIIVKSVRKLELILSRFLMAKFNKSIVVSKFLATEFNPTAPYFVLEGVYRDENMQYFSKCKSLAAPVSLVYAGSLCEEYGVMNIVNAVSYFDAGDVTLNLYGFGALAKLFEIKEFKNVNYHGVVKQESIPKILTEADFLINCRSDSDDFTRYSFPSKTMEYLASGTPVIMSMLKGIPEEYERYVSSVMDTSPTGIYRQISISIEKYDECLNKAHDGLAFVKTKSVESWSKRLEEFL